MIVRQLLTGIGYVVSKKSEKSATDSFKRVKEGAKTLGQFLIAGTLAQGFRAAIGYASQANENLNVINVAFENQAQAVLDWARTSGEAAGRSEFAMRQYAGTVGAMAGPTLGSAEATAKLSTDMAQLAVDLGSFFDASDEEALDALKAGLIGSSEPLMRFGVVMNEAALQSFATSKGLRTQVKDMKAAQKMQLRYQFIMDRTTKAQGDAARTGEGYANQLKRLGGNMRNILTDVGTEFLDNAAGLLAIFNKILVVLRGPLTIAFRSVANAIRFTTAVVIGLIEGFTKLDIVTQTVLTALLIRTLALHAPWLVWGALIAAAVGGVILLLDDLWVAMQGGDSAIASIIGNIKFLKEETGSYSKAVRLSLQESLDFWIEYFTGVQHGSWRIGEFIRNDWRTWSDDVGFVGDALGILARDFDSTIKGAIDGAIAWVRSRWPAFSDLLKQPIGPAIDTISKWFDGLVEDIEASFENMGESIKQMFERAGDAIYNVLKRIVGWFGELIDPLLEKIEGIFNLGGLGGWLGDVLGGLGDIDKLAGLVEPLQVAAPGSPAALASQGAPVAFPRQMTPMEPRPQAVAPQFVTREATANQSIEVNVNAPGADGPAIASVVAPAVGRAAADGNRRIAQQLLAGGATP